MLFNPSTTTIITDARWVEIPLVQVEAAMADLAGEAAARVVDQLHVLIHPLPPQAGSVDLVLVVAQQLLPHPALNTDTADLAVLIPAAVNLPSTTALKKIETKKINVLHSSLCFILQLIRHLHDSTWGKWELRISQLFKIVCLSIWLNSVTTKQKQN